MLTPKFLAASLTALDIVAGPAVGQAPTQETAAAQFSQLDVDGDGFVTKSEVAKIPGAAQRFDRFDADKDGKLDRGEFAALLATMK